MNACSKMERRGESCNKRHALSYSYFTGFPYKGKKSYNIKFWSRNQRIDWLCSRRISFVSCIHNQEKTLWEVWKNLRAVFEGAALTGFTMYPVKERTLVSLYDPEVGQWLMNIRIMACQRNLWMDAKVPLMLHDPSNLASLKRCKSIEPGPQN